MGIFQELVLHNGNEPLFQDLKNTKIVVIDTAKTSERVSSAGVPWTFQYFPDIVQ